MTGTFFEKLETYFSKVGEVLKGEADVASIFPNPQDIGTSRERIYAEVLRQHLPRSCNVSFGGFLFDMEGNESKQIDLIILNDVSPQFNFHNPNGQGKSFACVDGCVAVASIKSTLDSAKVIEALDNIASLPNKVALKEGSYNIFVKIRGYEDWPYKIIYASDGTALNTALDTVNRYYKENSAIPNNKRPNIIHVCGKYNIVRVGENTTTRGGGKIEANTFYGHEGGSDAYPLLTTILSIQEILLASKEIYYNYSDLINKLPIIKKPPET